MKVICAWCGTIIQDGPDNEISHGACNECLKKLIDQIEQGQKAKENKSNE